MKRVVLLAFVGVSAFVAWRYSASSDAADVRDAAQPSASLVEAPVQDLIDGPEARTELLDLAEHDRESVTPAATANSAMKPAADAVVVPSPEVDPAAAKALADARASAKTAEFLALAKQIATERMARGEYETVPFDAPSPEGARYSTQSIDESGPAPVLRRVVLFGDESPELAKLRDEADAARTAASGQR